MIFTPVLGLLLAGTASAATSLKARADDNWPIKDGYVAFGDSYAAGMGTGTTSTDVCRIGSNNFARLLNKWTNNDKVLFQERQCSGDITTDIDKQIEGWKERERADLGTISIGGNDLGFADLVYYCIITFNRVAPPGYNTLRCNNAKSNARKLLESGDMKERLKKVYKKIWEASNKDKFHLYVTSYAKFFNDEDKDCDKTTFDYWNPSYNTWWWNIRYQYLTTDFRKEMNGLLEKFNEVIQEAVKETNTDISNERVHFVDIDGSFVKGKHRWCEEGNFHEPDQNRADTWFFLAAWKDIPLDSSNGLGGVVSSIGGIIGAADAVINGADSAAADQADIEELKAAKTLELPDGKDGKCMNELGRDIWDRWRCLYAIDIAENPDGDFAKQVKDTNEAIKKGDFKTEDIPWAMPNRQAKMFHPRSPGMQGYRDAIIAEITKFQAADSGDGKCKVKGTQSRMCADPKENLFARITITGPGPENKQYYSTPRGTSSPLGLPINDGGLPRTEVKEGDMKEALAILGEHENDYIQFYYGETPFAFRPHDENGGGEGCKLVGNLDNWYTKDEGVTDVPKGCVVGSDNPDEIPHADSRDFECEFKC